MCEVAFAIRCGYTCTITDSAVALHVWEETMLDCTTSAFYRSTDTIVKERKLDIVKLSDVHQYKKIP